MPKAISAERWAAARALMRLEPPTQVRISAAMGINNSTLAKHLGAQGFEVLDYRRADIVAAHEELRERLIDRFVRGIVDAPVPVETLAMDAINAADEPTEPPPALTQPAPAEPDIGRAERVSRMLLKHADQLIGQVEAQGGALNKPQLDVMLAMVRLAEKFEPLAQKEAAQQQKKSDAEVAELYDLIDRRIEELARDYARELVARQTVG